MALHEVGLLVYSQGFAISRDEYIIRELAFCDWTGHHHVLFKYLLPQGVSYNHYPRRPKRASIVRPRQCMACPSNRTRLTTVKTFIPTIRCETISRVGVNSISPPSGDDWGCSRSMVCIDCSMSPSFPTPSWSWKGRGVGTWPISLLPPPMSWLTTIMVAIGAWIIPTGHEGVGSGTIIAPTCGSVK